MKEQTLIEMKNRVEMLGGLTQQIIAQLENLSNLSTGTLETLKKMPGYEEAIKELTAEAKQRNEEVLSVRKEVSESLLDGVEYTPEQIEQMVIDKLKERKGNDAVE